VDDDVPDLLADLGAAGLAHGHHVALQLLEALGEARDLGGLPAALGAFEGDEFARVLWTSGPWGAKVGELRALWRVSFEFHWTNPEIPPTLGPCP
jgi:hypothetical protein